MSSLFMRRSPDANANWLRDRAGKVTVESASASKADYIKQLDAARAILLAPDKPDAAVTAIKVAAELTRLGDELRAAEKGEPLAVVPAAPVDVPAPPAGGGVTRHLTPKRRRSAKREGLSKKKHHKRK